MSSQQYPVTSKLEDRVFADRQDLGILEQDLPPAVGFILEAVGDLEHQGMEPGAYSVTLEQYGEVAGDLCQVILVRSMGGDSNG